MERVTNLVFEWPAFIRAVVLSDAEISGHKLLIHTDKGSIDGIGWLVFRVWYHSPAGLTMFVGDVRLGPVTVWQASFGLLLRVTELAEGRGLTLEWSQLPEGEEEWIAPPMVTS